MDKTELLAELDTYFVARGSVVSEGTLGADINLYHISGIFLRSNDVAERYEVNFMVYREGLGGETAKYLGDPLNTLFAKKIRDYINVTQGYVGTVYRAEHPNAVCRLLETAVGGEKWVLITETAPDTYTEEDITGEILL